MYWAHCISLKEICDHYKAELYIDDHPHICREVKAAGVHLGKNDMPVPEARQLLGDNLSLGDGKYLRPIFGCCMLPVQTISVLGPPVYYD